MALVYNVNDTATQVLIARKIKENYYAPLLHRDGKGVEEHYETNVSTIRILKRTPLTTSARELGKPANGGFFNSNAANIASISEYDLPLLFVYDTNYDIPEVQQDMCSANIFDGAMTDIGGRIATEINASTLAVQLKAVYDTVGALDEPAWADNAIVLAADADYYGALLDASAKLDDGNDAAGVQVFPFDQREILLTSDYRKNLMSTKGVLLGGSNYAQSMLAKGGVSPDEKKDYGTMYIGEIDGIPCYLLPKTIMNRVDAWVATADAAKRAAYVDKVGAIVCAASATDRGISDPDYVKVVDSQAGAGKRLQPKTRWGINVCYPSGIIPILANGTAVPAKSGTLSVAAPGNV